ncbi:hypothetical protein Vadar_009497 [Vaccinium darrowii]|uniref:Uncharacterized protein n=1 Tax=Vaccinium darrowii TaxID=229202 RepID=A0ACB7YDS5_9ERIC|nr:hypothetical protein Vadar_009497 [Vaccinium darrowii]
MVMVFFLSNLIAVDGITLLKFVDSLLSSCGDERIIIFTTNHRDRHDVALVRPVNIDVRYLHRKENSIDQMRCGLHEKGNRWFGNQESPRSESSLNLQIGIENFGMRRKACVQRRL